ncbi:MAG TPA: zf-HC2 domain-containing protein [Candidatus Eisenbacteria bacterium]|nr:zf-HC2 domain-containing protein [Candidatus Eisenbacteria bacterium]
MTHDVPATPRDDRWTARLSEYLDGELVPAERAALEAHLPGCEACRAALGELRMVVARAAALPAEAPAHDLWPAIEERIAGGARVLPLSPRRVWELTLPQLAAAGFLIALLSAGTMWLVSSKHPLPPVPGAAPTTGPVASGGAATLPAGFDARRYDAAIADLERVLQQHRAELDPATVRVIEANLRIIDQATADARRALAADPASPYLNNHLAEQLQRKVDVLQQATAVVAAHVNS